MKRIFIIFAFIIGNSIFTSCTDLNEEQIQELEVQQEVKATGGEDGQTPPENEQDED
ncbi:hypothetical protein [uncultured Tenacibaculum sp.]|uniref:hypothetical protein n=1 Tax=uncultured Tenacibaculum sp. TaxID=174713 RepID=UPI0026258F6A|nr:hypothetical protein [uncultured Tenacibaculum sp.]